MPATYDLLQLRTLSPPDGERGAGAVAGMATWNGVALDWKNR